MNWVAPIKDDETLQKFRDTLRSVDDKYYILFEIGIGTGLQLQDILQFKVKDVRGKDMLIAVIGTRQIEQAFPLKPELQAVITDFIDGRDDEEYLITGFYQCCGICDPVIAVPSNHPVNLILCKSMSACIKNTGGIFCRKIPVIRMKHIVKLIMEFCLDFFSGPPKNSKEPVTDI